MALRIIATSRGSADPAVKALRDRLRGGGLTGSSAGPLDVPGIVSQILADIRLRGDEALVAWEKQLDGAVLGPETLRVESQRIARSRELADEPFMALVRRSADNIRQYQQHIKVQAPGPLVRQGRRLGVRYTPVDRAAVYVPGGRALYPSTVLMTVIPAQVAGVREVVMASPPTASGDIDPLVLALAAELGVTEVYRLGGAVAVGALAFGTQTVRPVAKIVGPGNAFVAEAKRQVLGHVGIDSIAGPSEVLIVADGTADARWLAADMLAQAEHDPGSAILVTDDEALARRVDEQIELQLGSLERATAARLGLEAYGAAIVVGSMDEACDVANELATEHLQIMTADDQAMLGKIRNAGAIFVGHSTPVSLGDYYAGPSHVLPTGGTARFFGPLSCNDFLKASSVIEYDASALAADGADVMDFASREGLTAHAAAVRVRLGQ